MPVANSLDTQDINVREMEEYRPLLHRPLRKKIIDFERDGRLKHVILATQFTRPLLEELCDLADMVRELASDPEGRRKLSKLLSHLQAMMYFTQPSTRTFLSFSAVCRLLGIGTEQVRDSAVSSESSEGVKRESRFDSIRMFSSYFDLIIMRSSIPDLAECCAYLMNELESQEFNTRNIPIINAGSGADQHPTQALLDLYTIRRTFRFADEKRTSRPRFEILNDEYPNLTADVSNKTFAFCGDLGRGRTVRSLVELLMKFENVSMVFISPDHPKFHLGDDLLGRLRDQGIRFEEIDSLDTRLDGIPILHQIDCLYMTRIQQEHNNQEDDDFFASADMTHYRLTPERVDQMRSYAPILHPFPRDSVAGEIPTKIDGNPRAMYFHQARNGLWARAALLVHIFNADRALTQAYREHYADLHDFNKAVL